MQLAACLEQKKNTTGNADAMRVSSKGDISCLISCWKMPLFALSTNDRLRKKGLKAIDVDSSVDEEVWRSMWWM